MGHLNEMHDCDKALPCASLRAGQHLTLLSYVLRKKYRNALNILIVTLLSLRLTAAACRCQGRASMSCSLRP